MFPPTRLTRLVEPSCLLLGLCACRQDMHDQPRYKPLAASSLFASGTSAREPVAGTVARGQTAYSRTFYSGQLPGNPAPQTWRPTAGEPPISPPGATDPEQLAAWRSIAAAEAVAGIAPGRESRYTDVLPPELGPLTEAMLRRGQERFDIYCALCHDRTGSGNGMIVRRGFSRPPSFHGERLRAVRLGHLFAVISSGFGAMPGYASQLRPADRWAIVAYIRALQLSQQAALWELPAAMQQRVPRASSESAGAR